MAPEPMPYRANCHHLLTLGHGGHYASTAATRHYKRPGAGFCRSGLAGMRGHHRKFARRPVVLTLTLMLVASCSPPVPNPPESSNISPPPPTATSSVRSEPKAATGAGRTITVKAGQSLGGIAKTYHVSKQALIAANHLHPPYELTTGARLIVPASTVAPARGIKPHGAQGSTKPAHAAKPSEPPEVIPLD
jgi:LysM repeat protein